MLIFNRWRLPFLILSDQLQNDKKPQTRRDWFLANCGTLVNSKVPGFT